MALVIRPGVANVRYIFSLDGSSHEMGFAVACSTDNSGSAQDIADNAGAAFDTGYGTGNMYSQWTFVGTSVVYNAGGVLTVAESTINAAGGGGGAETVPPNTSLVVKKTTGLVGKGQRGRFYMPPFSLADADVSDMGVIDNTPFATISDNIAAWLEEFALVVPGFDFFCLLHEQASPGPGNETEITNFGPESLVATQRRRLR